MVGTDDAAARLRILRRERFPIVHHHDERGVWATRGRDVLFQAGGEGGFRRIARFPPARFDAIGRLRLASRALRLDRCNVHPTRRGGLLGIRAGSVYRIDAQGFAPLCRIQGDCLMNRAIAEREDGTLFFGEYFTNGERRPVRIWRVAADLSAAEVACTLSDPPVRHVHGIQPDPFVAGRLWATTGDLDGECFLLASDDGFESLERVGDGSQTWRAVSLILEAERIAWLTDSELEQNRVISMDRRSRALATHDEVVSSTWYAARTSDGVHLATTTVEPGPAVRTRRSFLLTSEDARRWREAASFAKDPLPMSLFKFGSLSLPSGRFSSRAFWISGEGLHGIDGSSWLCALDAVGGPA